MGSEDGAEEGHPCIFAAVVSVSISIVEQTATAAGHSFESAIPLPRPIVLFFVVVGLVLDLAQNDE